MRDRSFAPRSWPSKPGFAMMTLIFFLVAMLDLLFSANGASTEGEHVRGHLLVTQKSPRAFRRARGIGSRASPPRYTNSLGRYSPKTFRHTSQISPTVARAFTAWRTAGRTFSLVFDTFSRLSRACFQAAWSRSFRSFFSLAASFSPCLGSTLRRPVGGGSSMVYLLMPTYTRSLDSISFWNR